MADWLKYSNQGATRRQPLSAKLVKDLSFLQDLGVTMDVFSGGQPTSGPDRVGSHRHDLGHAADAFLYKDGRKLDWNNPEDQPVFKDVVARAKAAGVTGFGAGQGYMQPGSIHIGYGTPAVWGRGGSGDNAAPWLREAYGGAGSPEALSVNASMLHPDKMETMKPTFAPVGDASIRPEQVINWQPTDTDYIPGIEVSSKDDGTKPSKYKKLANTMDELAKPQGDNAMWAWIQAAMQPRSAQQFEWPGSGRV